MSNKPVATPLPSGTVTFLFTDIEDSTPLAQQYPRELPRLLEQHHAILHQSIESHRGRVIRTAGDSFLATFYTAGEALRAALQAQRQLQQAVWQPAELKVRMGIHTGPAEASGMGEDGYSGYLTLARTQRVMAVAYGGQILVSAASAELLRGELPEEVELHDLGEHRLKGLLNLEHLWQVIAPDLLSEFPPLASLNAIPNNLPVQLSSFIGRQREIDEVSRLLQATRLLTLTGVGGSGKTRLSLQAAAEILDAYKDGIWLVELAPLSDPALVPQFVAAALGVREVPGRPLAVALVDYLRAKQLLLLLDNCEHLIESCSRLAEELLSACPQMRILASSREALGIAGETIQQVPSLSLPDPEPSRSLESLSRSEAGQLFLERARAVRPGFGLNAQNAPAIAQICQRLDGIPLALELAAARVKVFSTEQILDRLDDRFRLLTGGSRTALPRQQTLRALIDWSYDLLPQDERALLRRLSAFAGGWTFEAAEALAGQADNPSADLLDLLAHLIDKSLVMVDEPQDGGPARYRFLETIRQYAGEKLLDSGEAAVVRDHHLAYFLKFAEESEPKLLSSEQLHWLNRFEMEHDNFRAALAWGLDKSPDSALRLAGAVFYFWIMHGYIGEGRDWLTKVLAKVESLPEVEGEELRRRIVAQAKSLLGLGQLMISQGDDFEGLQAFEKSVALARQAGDKHILAKALTLVGRSAALHETDRAPSIAAVEEGVAVAREVGDYWSLSMAEGVLVFLTRSSTDPQGAQRTLMNDVLKLSHEIGDPWNRGMILMGSGMGAAHLGEYAEARVRFEECLALFRKIGDKYRINMVLSEMAHLERYQGLYEQALNHYKETLPEWQNLGHRAAVAHQLECFAFIAMVQGQAEQAAQLFGAAEALRENITNPMTAAERHEYDTAVASLRGQMDGPSFTGAWARGRELTLEAAIAQALGLRNMNERRGGREKANKRLFKGKGHE